MISRSEAIEMLRTADLISLGMQADSIRRRLHPAGVVTYVVDRAIDGVSDGIPEKIDDTAAQGGTGIRFEGVRDIESAEALLRSVRARFPLFSFVLPTSDIRAIAEASGLAVADVIVRLIAAGLDSVSGDHCDVHRAAHAHGLKTGVTVTFGTAEAPEALVDHLDLVRRIQQETGGFHAFTPLMKEEVTAVEYLKALAISRIYLENILNIQTSSATPGLKTTQLGLRFGSNDAGSVPLGLASEEELRHIIRDAGFVPKQRDALYRAWFLN